MKIWCCFLANFPLYIWYFIKINKSCQNLKQNQIQRVGKSAPASCVCDKRANHNRFNIKVRMADEAVIPAATHSLFAQLWRANLCMYNSHIYAYLLIYLLWQSSCLLIITLTLDIWIVLTAHLKLNDLNLFTECHRVEL